MKTSILADTQVMFNLQLLFVLVSYMMRVYQVNRFQPEAAADDSCILLSPQVRISVQSTHCHADRLNFEVISNKPYHSAGSQQPRSQGRSQLVQEVVRLAEEAYQQAQEKAARRPRFSTEEREFCQSKTPNLYSLLEEVRELALMDLEMVPQVCATTA